MSTPTACSAVVSEIHLKIIKYLEDPKFTGDLTKKGVSIEGLKERYIEMKEKYANVKATPRNITDPKVYTFNEEIPKISGIYHSWVNGMLIPGGKDPKSPYYRFNPELLPALKEIVDNASTFAADKETEVRVHFIAPGPLTTGMPHPKTLRVEKPILMYAEGQCPTYLTICVKKDGSRLLVAQSPYHSNMNLFEFSQPVKLSTIFPEIYEDMYADCGELVFQLVKGLFAVNDKNLPDDSKLETSVPPCVEFLKTHGIEIDPYTSPTLRSMAKECNKHIWKLSQAMPGKKAKQAARKYLLDVKYFQTMDGSLSDSDDIESPNFPGNILAQMLMILSRMHRYDTRIVYDEHGEFLRIDKEVKETNGEFLEFMSMLLDFGLKPVEAMCMGQIEDGELKLTYPDPFDADLKWGACNMNPNSSPCFQADCGKPGFFGKAYGIILEAMCKENTESAQKARKTLKIQLREPFNIYDPDSVYKLIQKVSFALVRKF